MAYFVIPRPALYQTLPPPSAYAIPPASQAPCRRLRGQALLQVDHDPFR